MKPVAAKTLFKGLWDDAPAGAPVSAVVTDNRDATEGSVFVAIKGERADGHDFAKDACARGAAFVVAARRPEGVPAEKTVLVDDVLDAMIVMGGNYREAFSPLLLGVTGSVGKTSTKEFCAAVFSSFGETLKTEGNQNNEIGMPKTLFRLADSTRYAVVEMGMQKPGEIHKLAVAARPSGAVISRIGQVHLETMGSIENVLRAKLEICDGLAPGAPLVLNGDDEMLRGANIREDVHTVYAGCENPESEVFADNIRREGYSMRFRIRDRQFGSFEAGIPALGRHNITNALLAYTAATRLGLSAEQSAGALGRYTPGSMRQNIRQSEGVLVIEDCYNAAPQSMQAALGVLQDLAESRKIAVLGDMLELGAAAKAAHADLGKAVAARRVDVLVAVGPLAKHTADAAQKAGVAAHWFAENAEASAALAAILQEGDTVLVKASRGMRFEEILETL